MKKVLMATAALAVALAVALPARAEGEKAEKKAEKPKQYTGEITNIEGGSVTVKKKDEEKTFTTGEKFKVVVPGKDAGELSDLKVGDKVTVHYREQDGKNVASRIVHSEAKPKKEKKEKSE
jgi:Cu/Ag efflux protein CusF